MTPGTATAPTGRSQWQLSLQRLRRHRGALAALGVLGVIVVLALLVPLLSPYDYAVPDWDAIYQPPGAAHWFGTDSLGRDLLVRVMWGCRISLLVGVAASIVSVVIGVVWGTTAGFAGGAVDSLMMRFVDILYAVPFIPLVIVLTVLFGRDFLLVFVAIGAVSWLDIARIVRGQTLSLKNREFIEAARALGVPTPTMIVRHLVPNLLGLIIIYATLTIPTVILFEAFLSFLGLGVHAPLASLGSLVSDGALHLSSNAYLLTVPAIFLTVIICAFSYLGDGLRDALDPREEPR
ncbi:MAG TPA: ABC transporter permease subunit [Steroidobacteraceae bacterium]|nr:ABC transporter permease subunit [Steroidobacteraceae bacterium]